MISHVDIQIDNRITNFITLILLVDGLVEIFEGSSKKRWLNAFSIESYVKKKRCFLEHPSASTRWQICVCVCGGFSV